MESPKELLKKINEQRKWFNITLKSIGDGVITTDVDGIITFINPVAEELTGYTSDEALGMPVRSIFNIVNEDNGEPAEISAERVMREGRVIGLANNTVLISRNGSMRSIADSAAPIKNESGEILGVVLVFRDVTERKKAEAALKKSEALFRAIVEDQTEFICRFTRDGRLTFVNEALCKYINLPREKLIGSNYLDFVPPKERADLLRDIRSLTREKPSITIQHSVLVNGKKRFLQWTNRIIDDKASEYQAVGRDITEQRKAEKRLKYLGSHDRLTGLYNRAYFEEEMRRLDDGRHHPVGLMVCDLDGLKLVNDTMGHDAGDRLLRATAILLKKCFEPNDVISRIGGDEFAVILRGPKSVVEKAYRRILREAKSYNAANPGIPLNISVGYAVSTKDKLSINELFKEADNNMYREKLHQGNSSRSSIVAALMKTLEARDIITEEHSDRVQNLVISFAKALGLSTCSITDLRLLAKFHDIGKVGIPDRILSKPSSLTREEKAEMQRHCEIGHRIALSAPELAPIADWILKHHEWWNGGGYPFGLKGEDIPLQCRILAIADAFEAMISNRPYRMAMSLEEAVKELRRCAGIQFDPNLVELFLTKLGEKSPSSSR